MLTLDTRVRFTWFWSENFLLESDKAQFWVWSDPEYGGDNTIRPYKGDYKTFCKDTDIDFGRCKGQNTVRKYCGESVKLLTTPWAKQVAKK